MDTHSYVALFVALPCLSRPSLAKAPDEPGLFAPHPCLHPILRVCVAGRPYHHQDHPFPSSFKTIPSLRPLRPSLPFVL